MKTIAVSLLLGAGALSMTVPASAEGLHSNKTTLGSTASAQVDMSSRHRHHRVRRVGAYRNTFTYSPLATTPLAAAPFILSYRTYGRHASGPPAPYATVAPGSYTYAPLPYADTYAYVRVRYRYVAPLATAVQ
jgi:hypothetical protein